MKRLDWQIALKEMERLLGIAKDNVEKAEAQVEELEFNISNYKEKIKCISTSS